MYTKTVYLTGFYLANNSVGAVADLHNYMPPLGYSDFASVTNLYKLCQFLDDFYYLAIRLDRVQGGASGAILSYKPYVEE